jgi:hypothetical protein
VPATGSFAASGGGLVNALTRALLTVASGVYLAVVVLLFGRVPLPVFNLLLATTSVPLVRVLWVIARALVFQDAKRWARDIEKVHASKAELAGRVRR